MLHYNLTQIPRNPCFSLFFFFYRFWTSDANFKKEIKIVVILATRKKTFLGPCGSRKILELLFLNETIF